jgi:hypothetical protein
MKEAVIHLANLQLGYTQKLVQDIPDDKMTAQPIAGKTMNHPAWVLGHLARSTGMVVKVLGRPEIPLPANNAELFGQKSQPLADASRYPSKAELMKSLEHATAQAIEAFRAADDATLNQPSPEPMRGRFPTLGVLASALLAMHSALHNGQLSAWRRAMGLPSVM